MIELSEDCYTARAALHAILGPPFFLYLRLDELSAGLIGDQAAARAAKASADIDLLSDQLATEINNWKLPYQRWQAEAQLIIDSAPKGVDPKNLKLPPEPPRNVSSRRYELPIVVDAKPRNIQDIIADLAKRDNPAGRTCALYLQRQKLGTRNSELGTHQALLAPQFAPIPPDRVAHITAAAQQVAREIGVSKQRLQQSDEITLRPFARGSAQRDVASRSRYAVLRYIQLSGERHDQIKNQILSANVTDPLPVFKPILAKA